MGNQVPLDEAHALVRRLFEIIDGRDFGALGEVFAPDAVYERPGYEPLAGLERLTTFYRDERIIISGAHQVEDVASGEGVVISRGVFTGKSRDGADLNERFADVYRVEGGKIRHRTTYFFRAAI
ncbi:nuclear transport factor 2 family protein [Deinococcus sp. Marseille-Q6407]|uniref:nuclear transport factor 2 family protein n=1 Tax=Deinococcus sp. Marseille-Q6407 TaxID=2969223 RepID=UPI0021BF9310|nr:nuclear transport factor 2 family protein [Deinococcus sp. Marseille-Q6407]